MQSNNNKPVIDTILKWAVMGFFIFATVVAALARLSCIGFGVLMALALIPIGTAMQLVAFTTIKKQWSRLTVATKLLPVLMALFYMAAFFFQEDGGDDAGGYAIYMFLNIKHYYFKGIDQIAETAAWAYLICFYLFLYLAYYRTGEKKLFKRYALLFLIPVTPLVVLYVMYYIDTYQQQSEYYRDYQAIAIPYNEDDYDDVRKFKLYRYPNQYTQIPDTIFKFSNLEELTISQQEVTSIPKEIIRLQKLTVIDASSNRITKIPKEVGLLQNLQVLHLDGNFIDSVPDFVCNCTKLKSLRVGGPMLTYIPDCIGKLRYLETLEIGSDILIDQKDSIEQRFKNVNQVLVLTYNY